MKTMEINTPICFVGKGFETYATLQPEDILTILEGIKTEKWKSDIEALRKVRKLSLDHYKMRKTRLPWFIGSTFEENRRRKEHFKAAYFFTLDIDFPKVTEERLREYKQRLSDLAEVWFAYISPSGQGLKVGFVFEQPCTQIGAYKANYLAKAKEVAEYLQVEEFMDFKTHDVTRVHFVSSDTNMYLNPNPKRVAITYNDPEEQPTNTIDLAMEPKKTNIPYQEILETLGGRPKKEQKMTYVPPAILTMEATIFEAIMAMGWEIQTVKDLNYGRQYLIKDVGNSSVMNLFFGKAGFKALPVPSKGSHKEFAEACCLVIERAIDQ